MLRASGSVTVAEIEDHLGVSPMTARRDLAELERRGVVRRNHGGAVLPPLAAHEDSFASRLEVATQAKEALGAAGAAMVHDGQSLFLDSSTTAWFVARALLDRGARATVITNSLPIMDLVAGHTGMDLELVGVGGALRRLTHSFVGPQATDAIARHAADLAFFSVKGVTGDGQMTDPDALEADVKRAMIRNADETVLLLDDSKLSVHGLHVVDHVAAIRHVMVHGAAASDLKGLRAAGARVRDAGVRLESAS